MDPKDQKNKPGQGGTNPNQPDYNRPGQTGGQDPNRPGGRPDMDRGIPNDPTQRPGQGGVGGKDDEDRTTREGRPGVPDREARQGGMEEPDRDTRQKRDDETADDE